MIKGVGHIGLVVSDIERTLESLAKIVSFPKPMMKESAEAQKKVAVVDLGNVGLELIQDMTKDGPLAQLVKSGENKIHHFCLLSDNIEEDLETIKANGIAMQDPKPKIGLRGKKCALSAPSALNGIPIELSEP
jgi:methylmalonyl-CoA/ethylmalonyl-CoA epimerase